MTMSERERRLLAEMARRIAEQDPELASALQGWSAPVPRPVGWPRRVAVRWREKFRRSEHAPLRTAVAGGVLFVAGLMLTGGFSNDPAPVPGAQIEMPVFAEQQLEH